MSRRLRLGMRLVIAAVLTATVTAHAKPLPPAPDAPAVGTTPPAFTLPDSAGTPRTLASLRTGAEGKPAWLLLVFYRGAW